MPIGSFVYDRWRRHGPALLAVIVAVLAGTYIVLAVRPFAPPLPESQTESLAKSWNDGIAKLGIIPVFPPEEDVNVGDVWAVIAETEDMPLLGRGLRVAHLSLRNELLREQNNRFQFSETSDVTNDGKIRRQTSAEIANAAPGDRIQLTIAAFPGITIRRSNQATGSMDLSFAGLSAGREESMVEEVRIPVAETYGVPVAAAVVRLDQWCSDSKTQLLCSDAFVRRALAYGVDRRVLATRNGEYIAKLNIHFINRVFLTREIEHRRMREGAIKAAGDSTVAFVRASDVPSPPGSAETGGEASTRNGGDAPPGGFLVHGKNARADSSEFLLRQSFQRPIAFGFRAITFALEPSTPSNVSVP
ncbi:hypothetical protein [Azospirillum brasilense]|uniref:hypothetical protein n=1 Tax=Azospirillum brasilense TaxID=192 RepID=UPI0013B3D297|nr:hypothetical protein [Azospirillum brasilense]